MSAAVRAKELLFRLIEKKTAFEWQQGVLISWDGATMKLMVNGQPHQFTLSPDAPIYQRVGDEKLRDPDARLPAQFREPRC